MKKHLFSWAFYTGIYPFSNLNKGTSKQHILYLFNLNTLIMKYIIGNCITLYIIRHYSYIKINRSYRVLSSKKPVIVSIQSCQISRAYFRIYVTQFSPTRPSGPGRSKSCHVRLLIPAKVSDILSFFINRVGTYGSKDYKSRRT